MITLFPLNNNKFDKKIEFGTFYNVQGRTLQVVGIGNIPDVYTEPFHSLKLTASKSFGLNDSQNITLKVDNLLGDVRESRYDYFGNTDFLFSRLNPGRSFGAFLFSLSFESVSSK